ncbi:hypothetical protein M5D96_001092 [Drosophila gunungcola]|uniref:Uncharacterized protein n=1 Tax=Drosophila gunungcola TaxID=103775 RepID=A0A9Q0BUQ7_9MUSC|nr:hypothetical protein M5D96_001092 [Drosophila gunungcola]
MNITSSPKVLMKCRICLGDSEEQTMSSLFDDEAENDDLLIEKVEFCCGIKVYWETSFPDSERPEDLLQASDGEYMEYLYEKLQLNSGLENNYQEEISQTTEEEQQLEDNVQEVLDVNGYIIDEQIEEENETDSSLLNEEYYEVDYEELHEDDFLSTSPSPDPSPKEDPRNSGRFRKLGRPRKPDSELKFKRKEISAQGKATKSKIEDKLVCNLICNKAFRQMGELRAHIRRHTGVRPYKCMYCDRHFYDRSERVRHERVHTNTRPYACQECGKTFTHTAILKNHLLVHSGEKNYRIVDIRTARTSKIMPEYMLCRICLTEDINSEAMAPLFDDDDAQCRELVRKIEEVGSIKLVPLQNIPSMLCYSCVERLTSAHKFRELCQESERTFATNVVKAEMKSEPTDDVPHIVADHIEYIYESANDFIDGVEEDIEMENMMEERLEDGVAEITQPYDINNVVDELDENDLLVRKSRMTKRGRGRPRGSGSGHARSLSQERPSVQSSCKSSPEESSTNIMCEICGNIYSKRAALNIHMRRHMAEKPFECECRPCNKTFSRKHQLEQHIGTMTHQQTVRNHQNNEPMRHSEIY